MLKVKPRIAVCLSGFVRDFRRHVWSVADYDVFISTWDRVRGIDTATITEQDLDIYKPKGLEVEPFSMQEGFKQMEVRYPVRYKCTRGGLRRGSDSLSMFYKIWRANELKRQYELKYDFKYDIVVRARTDRPIRFPLDKFEPERGIHIPYRYGRFGGNNWMHDQIAFGTSELMDGYSDCYQHMPDYLNAKARWVNECIIHHHLDMQQLPVYPVPGWYPFPPATRGKWYWHRVAQLQYDAWKLQTSVPSPVPSEEDPAQSEDASDAVRGSQDGPHDQTGADHS